MPFPLVCKTKTKSGTEMLTLSGIHKCSINLLTKTILIVFL
jgi:hypothetical protein